ncbi:LacI family DNA-binding transcriptional regulator [Brachybacterium hainanense]|uniref:LacI family DNA-binding transcriptional regulator n=1 Tax=Brachybacterium hainanense TaxID=1541174 RepID=A0ABV6R6I0_9MICO
MTLTAVARAAGVSLGTASKVMSGREDVGASTREAVAAIAAEMGYVARRRAPAARRRVIIVFHTLTSPYELEVLQGAEEAAHRAGIELLIVRSKRDGVAQEVLTRSWLADEAERGVTGIVAVTTPVGPKHVRWTRELGLPMIVVDPVTDASEVRGLVTVSATNWEGGMEATGHLVELGHRRIGVLAGPEDSIPAQQRVLGYRTVLEQSGLVFDPQLVVPSSFAYDAGYAGTRQLLSLPDPPSAIFAVSDTLGVGVLRTARERGLEVPQDLSVVSFDDSMITNWTFPQLTAVHQPLFSMGQVAVERLLALAADPGRFAHPFKLETHLIVRESTAPPRG